MTPFRRWPPAAPRKPRDGGAEEVLLRRLEALGLVGVVRLRLTDNRSVMVSLSRARVLSVHRGYTQAPDRVLSAVVRFLARGTRGEIRKAAEHEILSFHPERHAQGLPRRARSADRPAPGDAGKMQRLERMFAELNARHFAGSLPALPIRVSGRMRSRLGQLCLHPDSLSPYEITISRRHIERHGWREAGQTLLHEMVHLWQHASGQEVDHGPRFRAKARALGVAPSARRVASRTD